MNNIRGRILCAEDDGDACELLAALLGSRGYEAATARSARVAERTAREGSYDLYLLDGRYAEGAGVELCQRIRRFDPHTPVVFFSGLAQDYDREQALAAGAQAYLVKPNDLSRLAGTVTRLLDESQPAGFASHRTESRGNTLRRRRPAPPPDTQRGDSAAAG